MVGVSALDALGDAVLDAVDVDDALATGVADADGDVDSDVVDEAVAPVVTDTVVVRL